MSAVLRKSLLSRFLKIGFLAHMVVIKEMARFFKGFYRFQHMPKRGCIIEKGELALKFFSMVYRCVLKRG